MVKGTTARLNPATTLRKKLGKQLENTTTINLIESLFIIQRTQPKPSDNNTFKTSSTERTSTDNTKPKNHISTKSAFNFYVNEKISSLLGTPVNTESARETFYKELIQNTNLSTNHNFASIITEINKEIEHHTQQRYPITYANKGKGKLQTPAVTPRKIQPSAWKKNRVESPSNPSYHYILGSAINITSASAKQKKTDLLEPYGEYFEGFNSRSSIPSGLRSLLPPPDFGISNPWEAAESEKKEKKLEDQEFTYQNPITKSLEVETLNLQAQQNLNIENSEIETPNQQRQNNPNPELINQQNLSPVIVINQLPINPVAKLIQQPFQLPP
ncbi:hypothetical protein G9A89_018372 [Geosiphon pyriformis]|nr:hypothetical protein G9A89_018372 [Geosiphon pyriformis]